MLPTAGREQLTIERSWFGDLHDEVAVILRKFTVDKIPSSEVIILCYHAASVNRIASSDPKSNVFSINRYQGRECDFAIIVTTRVARKDVHQNADFILDPCRTTVVLSRARQGVFIIGDMDLLEQSDVWRRYVQQYPRAFNKLNLFHNWMRDYDHRRHEERSCFS